MSHKKELLRGLWTKPRYYIWAHAVLGKTWGILANPRSHVRSSQSHVPGLQVGRGWQVGAYRGLGAFWVLGFGFRV